jgi:hypothetical protein
LGGWTVYVVVVPEEVSFCQVVDISSSLSGVIMRGLLLEWSPDLQLFFVSQSQHDTDYCTWDRDGRKFWSLGNRYLAIASSFILCCIVFSDKEGDRHFSGAIKQPTDIGTQLRSSHINTTWRNKRGGKTKLWDGVENTT